MRHKAQLQHQLGGVVYPVPQVTVQSLVVMLIKLRNKVHNLKVSVDALGPCGVPRSKVIWDDAWAGVGLRVWRPLACVPHDPPGFREHEVWPNTEREVKLALCEPRWLVSALIQVLHDMELELRD